jgi:tRNA(Ile)-lysidine synthase TilS/MesJ
MPSKCIVLFSGGLDSIIAVHLPKGMLAIKLFRIESPNIPAKMRRPE